MKKSTNNNLLKGLSILEALVMTGCASEQACRSSVVVSEPTPVVVMPVSRPVVVPVAPPPPPRRHHPVPPPYLDPRISYPPYDPRFPHPLDNPPPARVRPAPRHKAVPSRGHGPRR